jgi:Flp pilus assembly protein CpaB
VLELSQSKLDNAIAALLPQWWSPLGLFEDKKGVPKFGQPVERDLLTQYLAANDGHNERSPVAIPTSVVNLAIVSSGTGNLAPPIPQLRRAAAIAVVAEAFDVAVHEEASIWSS